MFLSNLGSRDILPAVPPPLGQTYDPNAPNTLYQWNILCEAVSLTVTAILVWLRLYTKARIVKKFGLEDCEFYDYLASIITHFHRVLPHRLGNMLVKTIAFLPF